VLLLNKSDLKTSHSNKVKNTINDWAKEQGCVSWFETSALERRGFKEALAHAAELINQAPRPE
jgi:hypothetical protein